MTDIVVVLCTCESETQAEHIAKTLVNERLAACVNILPAVRSIYRWQDAVEDAREHLLFIKTTEPRLRALRDRIVALHSYDTPELLAIPVAEGSDKYLEWLRAQV